MPEVELIEDLDDPLEDRFLQRGEVCQESLVMSDPPVKLVACFAVVGGEGGFTEPEGVLPMGVPDAAKRGRVNAAGCRWDTSLVQTELDDLRGSDRGAWAKLIALIADSEQHGLPFDEYGFDYSAPVGERVKPAEFRGRPVPWLGELRVEERTPKSKSRLGDAVQYRLYFGEPNDPADLVLGLSIGRKRGRDRDAGRKQTRQMVDAMWKLIRWCESRSPRSGWREWAARYNVDL